MVSKRGISLIFIAIILISFFIFSISVLAQQQDETLQIKKAYTWLQGKAVGRWQNLNLQQHVFSFLALKEKLTQNQIDASIRSLLQKSYNNGTCWPSSGCNAFDTALAKIVLDSVNKDSSKASEWLLNNTITPTIAIGGNWLLQLTQPQNNNLLCMIRYDTTEISVEFDKKGQVSSLSSTECFSNATYWLQLNPSQQCFEKEFNITCNDSFMGNFFFEKTGVQKEYYVVSSTLSAQPLEAISLKLITKCIANMGNCDYEATLWTAYAFANQPSISRMFIPYLVMKANENKKFLPEAILYKLTSQQNYAETIALLQGTDGLIVANNTAYNKYHDTGLASITGSTINANITKLKEKLLQQQIKTGTNAGSWECLGCDNIRETAILLYGVWPNFEWRTECEIYGFNCVSNCSVLNGSILSYYCSETLECCNLTSSFNCEMKYGECKQSCSNTEAQVPYSCQSGVCCKNYSISLCVSEIGGTVCGLGQECTSQGRIVPFIYSSDSPYCCKGICSTATLTCQQANGSYCDPNSGYSCLQDKWIQASDTLYCCQTAYCTEAPQTCQQKGGEICSSDEDCKDGILVNASDTNGLTTCCIQGGRCIPKTCNYNKCETDENCVGGNSYETSDALKCCEGQCLKSCSAQRGVPCNASMTCKGTIKQASDVSRCCLGECKKKGGFPTTILIIIIIVVIILALFYLIKTGKIKIKGKPKAAPPTIEYGFGIPPRGMPPRGLPSITTRTMPQTAQAPVKPMPKPMAMAKPAMPQKTAVKTIVKKKLSPAPKVPKPSA
ncbi:MAG: hypothetical protein QW484_02935 [Candidatus Pacearchaeota archaeon]